jgi:radical SAM protein with 4Fe4S-binding SPASM domain
MNTSTSLHPDQNAVTAVSGTPGVAWIELTSKCPFKCVFCSRELLRGAGEHMDIALYRKLISELTTPQVIRLNYSGESAHYPHLVEAITLAKQTGARVELVSALSSIKLKLIEPLVRSGLDLLCVSIHTLEAGQYQDIYGFGSTGKLLQRLEALRETQALTGISTPQLEFALVAMERNLDQISAVMELADRFEVARLDIHPVIRRDPIAETFPQELDESNRLRQGFIERLSVQVEASRRAFPTVLTGFSTPEINARPATLDQSPRIFPGRLPPGARILGCEQNPRNTIHVLANGDVVSCEVRDQQPLGNLAHASLESIWKGPGYQEFRRRFQLAKDEKCAVCAYKIAYLPTAQSSSKLSNKSSRPSLNGSKRLVKTSIAHIATAGLMAGLVVAQGTGRVFRRIRSHRYGLPASSPPSADGGGISVIIPERDSPDLLRECLAALYQAVSRSACECEVIVVVNGAPADRYAVLKSDFPSVLWHFETHWMGFAEAIKPGLDITRFPWVFLLNSDMILEPDALHEVSRYRSRQFFAIACQVFMSDKTKRREETGFTGLDPAGGLQGLYDGAPYLETLPTTHFYAGGGASLFQKALLVKLIEPRGIYAPFYWEDVDWGFRAQQLACQVLFVPQAIAHHRHRATVSRFFSERDIGHWFERNALLSGLSQGWYQPPFAQLSAKLAQHRGSVFGVAQLSSILKKRFEAGCALLQPRLSNQDVVCFFPRKPVPGDQRPWLVLVTPYLISPRSHGGAVRIDAISRGLALRYRLVLVCDEGWGFDPAYATHLDQFEAVHLLLRPRASMADNRMARMKGHARPLLRQELVRVLGLYRPSIVQIEYEELCDLVKLKRFERWFITLHDVNRGEKNADAHLDRRLRRFDGVFCCSIEDQRQLPLKSHLIENGASLSRFSSPTPSTGEELLFIGPFRFAPNRQGIESFIHAVFPRLTVKFPGLTLKVLCGDEGMKFVEDPPFNHPKIELVSHTDTIEQHLETATLTINPLRGVTGSCLKTIESLAAHRVCVSTPDAARGLNHCRFPGLLLADSPNQFAEVISSLLEDESGRHYLEKPPPEQIRRFDWNTLAASQVAAYES